MGGGNARSTITRSAHGVDVPSLAPILSRRLRRRGTFPAVRTIRMTECGGQRVADFGLVEVNDELLQVLGEVASPLPVMTHESPDLPSRSRSSQARIDVAHAVRHPWR